MGACVGMKGTRVQSIIRELRGEKIDIVEWSDDAVQFVEKALSPAKISRVTIVDEEQKIMEVVVEDKQLSLAIGKKGQNVRLAAKLVGWRIDIKSEEEKRQEVEAEMARMARMVDELRSLPHVGEKTIQKLIDAGVQGLSHILEMTDERSARSRASGPKTAEKIREAAEEAKLEWDQRDAEEAARYAAEQAAAEEAARRGREQAAADQAAAERGGADAGRAGQPNPPPNRCPPRPAATDRRDRRMANVRVFQLARDLGIPSQEVIDRLKKLGVEVKTASSSIDEDTADKLKRALKIDALTAKKRRVYGSEEDEAEREEQERACAAQIAAEQAEREAPPPPPRRPPRRARPARARNSPARTKRREGAQAKKAPADEAPPALHPPPRRAAPRAEGHGRRRRRRRDEDEVDPEEHGRRGGSGRIGAVRLRRPAPPAGARAGGLRRPRPRRSAHAHVRRASRVRCGRSRRRPPPAPPPAPAARPRPRRPARPARAPTTPIAPRPALVIPRPLRPIAPPRPVGPHPTSPHSLGGADALPRSPHPMAPPRPGMTRRPGCRADVADPRRAARRLAPWAAPRPAGPRAQGPQSRASSPGEEERPVYTGPAAQDHPHRRRHGQGAGREDGRRQEPRHHEGAHHARHHGHRQPGLEPAARDRDRQGVRLRGHHPDLRGRGRPGPDHRVEARGPACRARR